MLLTVWLYAKEEGFSPDRCKYVGVHALRCREAEKLGTRFCRIAGLNEFKFEFPNIRDFAHLILIAFPDHLARIKSRGTQMYESVNGYHLHLNKFSEVNCSEWVIALNLVEKSIKGKVGLEMEFVTELDEQIIEKVLAFEVKEKEEVILDPETRKVVQRTYKQIGKIKYNVKERVTVCREDMQRAYSTELSNGNLKLKKWDSRVDHFLSRILFLNCNYPEYELTPFDDDAKTLLFDEICKDSSSWKEIRNREVLPALLKLYSEEEIKILDSATPSTISLNNGKNFHRVEYDGKHAILKIKLQDLYDVKTHPSIVFNRHLITLHILAPNNRCVQITDKLNEFWEGSYLNVKKELAGRYPKHEWR
jgi:ATP-dependent helicase HrpB